jgi:trypsin
MMHFITSLLLLIAPLLVTAANENFTEAKAGSAADRAKLESSLKDSGIVFNDTQPFPYIIGGEIAGSGEFPWFGRTDITFLIGFDFLVISCGGSLIHEDIVVSAAHCIVDTIREYPGAPFFVNFNLGANQYDGSDGIIYEVATVYWPDSYSFPFNDIVFYKLSVSTSVQPVSLNTNPSLPSVGDFGTAIGFGKTSNDGEGSPILLKVELATISNAACDQFYRDYDESIICTFTQGKSTCQGDSGGPIVTQSGALFGLTSFGPAGGCDTGPTGFTRISWYSDYIASVSRPIIQLKRVSL